MKRILAGLRRRSGTGGVGRSDLFDRRLATVGDARTEMLLTLAAAPLSGPAPVVGLLALPDDSADVDNVRRGVLTVAPDAAVTVLDASLTDSDLHVRLAAGGRYDVLVDVATDAEEVRSRRVRRVLFRLRRHGVLVVADAVPEPVDPDEETPADKLADADEGGHLARLVTEAFDASLRPAPKARRGPRDRPAWGQAVAGATVRQRHLAITNGLEARAKVREDEVSRYLELAGPRVGEVLLERPGAVLEGFPAIRQNDVEGSPPLYDRFEAPPLQLRRYDDVLCYPGQIASVDAVLLPETFRHLARPRLGNRFIDDVAPRYGRIKKQEAAKPLAGTYFHLDSEYRGHFGHAMTEQISRLWAWEEAKRREPGIKALLLVNRFRREVYDWEYRLYEAAGVAREDIVLATEPVRVDRLLAATPMFSQPQYVHTGIREVYRRIGDHLAAEAPQRDYPARIFCSRRLDKRSCHNTGDVEAFFAAHGFEIVYPEDYPLPEQVQMFRAAEQVAGFGGSAMFTIAFVPEPTRVTLVSSANYWAWNEFLMAAVLGHEVNVAWCTPDLPRSEGYRGEQALQSPYTFEVERDGAYLSEALSR